MVDNLMLQPRKYQLEALDALDLHVRTKTTNPCVVLPTGSGKSLLIAWIVKRWKLEHPPLKAIILAHRKELIVQNSEEMAEVWPEINIGIYSAGLQRRDTDHDVIYASIDSVYKKGGEFSPFDVIVIDEAHRLSPKAETKYQQFIKMQRIQNKNIIVVGFTATPYRMSGIICHKDHVLNEIVYEADMRKLIDQGYLCKLWSQRSDIQPDLTDVKINSGGDYVVNSLAKAVDKKSIVSKAVEEAVSIIHAEKRQSIIFFCINIAHGQHVSKELAQYGIDAPCVTAKTPSRERDRIVEKFKSGELHAICNISVYLEGFNARQVDCIVLLRPTRSKGLYTQACGRGLRIHPAKNDCLILDFARCIEEHGPIDCVSGDEVPLYTCTKCKNVFSRQIGVCPHCGWEIPKQEIEMLEAQERERRLHSIRASNRNILSGEPEEWLVDSVMVHRHSKKGKPDSLRVEYRCGLNVFREWVCLDHEGFAQEKAHQWWRRRFGDPVPTVDEALGWIFLAGSIKEMTESVTTMQSGKHVEITKHCLK